MTVGTIPGPPALHCLLSAGCLLCLENSPSGEASASAWRFSWRPGAAGALTVALTAAASLREFYPLCLVLPLRGSDTYLVFVPQLEALSESLTHSIPRSFLVVSLSAYAVGFADALWLCPERVLRLFFASVSLVNPIALSPLSRSVCWRFPSLVGVSSCGGASPHALGSIGALGDLRWLHLYRLTPDLVSLRQFAVCRWSSGRCFILFLRDVPQVFMTIILSVSLTYACPSLIIPIGWCSLDTWRAEWRGWLSVPLLALPGLCRLRWLLVTTVWSWCILR